MECPWDWAFQLGQGEGPSRIVGPISQPGGIIDTASRTLIHTNAHVRFLNLKLIKAAKGDLHPHESLLTDRQTDRQTHRQTYRQSGLDPT